MDIRSALVRWIGKLVVGLGAAAALAAVGVWQLGTTTTRACRELTKFDEGRTGTDSVFPTKYADARQRFLEAARATGGIIESVRNPN